MENLAGEDRECPSDMAWKLSRGFTTLSIELFPPKNPAGWGTLYGTLSEISRLKPDFVSVTYGAGGTTRSKTVDLVGRIQSELGIESMAHLTCVGHSAPEIGEILDGLDRTGVRNVLALRGDPPKGESVFQSHAGGFGHASDLISFISRRGSFRIGCAFYPEKHPEASTLEEDISYLKVKQDSGAQFAVSQMFFDNACFYAYREKAARAGVNLPLVAGIMPVVDKAQLARFRSLAGCTIPETLLHRLGTEEEDMARRGMDFAVEQCLDLLANGVSGLHIYCLNRSASAGRIVSALRENGHFPLPEPETPALKTA